MVGGKGQKKYKRPIMAMKNRKSKLSQYSSLCVVVLLLLVLVNVGVCQNCGCSKDLCCSRYGYCGTGNAYCGEDCREGPCYPSLPSTGDVSYIIFLIYVTTSPHPIWNTIEDVGSITASVFNSIVGEAGSGCAGMGFYNYNAFITAANAFNGFGTSGSSDFQKREVAAFFANAAHETGGFCFIEEQNTAFKYCQASSQYPCNPNKRYYGRGPLQLSWNFNYGAAGNYINFDGLNNPEAVATDPTISFKTAVWFWMLSSNCHKAITSGQGFGATIKAINSMECNGGNSAAVTSRVNYYQKFSQQLNIDPGSNLRC